MKVSSMSKNEEKQKAHIFEKKEVQVVFKKRGNPNEGKKLSRSIPTTPNIESLRKNFFVKMICLRKKTS